MPKGGNDGTVAALGSAPNDVRERAESTIEFVDLTFVDKQGQVFTFDVTPAVPTSGASREAPKCQRTSPAPAISLNGHDLLALHNKLGLQSLNQTPCFGFLSIKCSSVEHCLVKLCFSFATAFRDYTADVAQINLEPL